MGISSTKFQIKPLPLSGCSTLIRVHLEHSSPPHRACAHTSMHTSKQLNSHAKQQRTCGTRLTPVFFALTIFTTPNPPRPMTRTNLRKDVNYQGEGLCNPCYWPSCNSHKRGYKSQAPNLGRSGSCPKSFEGYIGISHCPIRAKLAWSGDCA